MPEASDKSGPAKTFILDNLIQTIAGIATALAIPLGIEFPQAIPYIAIAVGAITFLMGKMYPDWKQSFFAGK